MVSVLRWAKRAIVELEGQSAELPHIREVLQLYKPVFDELRASHLKNLLNRWRVSRIFRNIRVLTKAYSFIAGVAP